MTIGNFPQDHHAQYALHRMMLQHIQYTRPPKRWVLKGFHGRRLRALFDTYPDARIVWVHRDPVQVLASQIVAFGQINESLAGTLDWTSVRQGHDRGRRGPTSTPTSPTRSSTTRASTTSATATSSPTRSPRSAASTTSPDVPFTTETEKAMRDYLVTNRSDRYGKFTYSTDVLPVPVQELHEEFAAYRDRFGIDIETRH